MEYGCLVMNAYPWLPTTSRVNLAIGRSHPSDKATGSEATAHTLMREWPRFREEGDEVAHQQSVVLCNRLYASPGRLSSFRSHVAHKPLMSWLPALQRISGENLTHDRD